MNHPTLINYSTDIVLCQAVAFNITATRQTIHNGLETLANTCREFAVTSRSIAESFKWIMSAIKN